MSALDAGVIAARTMIAEGLGRLGVRDRQGIHVAAGTNGTVLLYRARSTGREGLGEPDLLTVTDDPADPLTPEAKRDVATAVLRHGRRTLRRGAIMRAGGGNADPAWSCTMHRVLRGWFMAKGVDPVIGLPGTDAKGGDFLMNYMAQQAGLSIGKSLYEDGRVDFDAVVDDALQYAGGRRCSLIVSRDVPDTLVAALPGRLVSEVIDHPAIRRAGPVRVRAASATPGTLVLEMEDVHDFIRRPPKGFDRKWSRLPFTADAA